MYVLQISPRSGNINVYCNWKQSANVYIGKAVHQKQMGKEKEKKHKQNIMQ